jgi:cation diffusion facilitator family transporter
MSSSNSTKAVVFALSGNLFITIIKFIAAFFTKSASMSAEAIHSSADCLNQVFLLVGNKRTQKETDEKHPFGYGREEFFWGFIVAILLFFGGAAYSFYEGIHKLANPEPVQHITWALIVLGISIVIEGKTFLIAYNEMKKTSKGSLMKAIKKSVDINLIVILLEDAAALVGLFIAFACTLLATVYPIFDGIGSLLVGATLCYVSYALVNELRQLIIGESMPRKDRARIKEIVGDFDVVTHVNRIKTMTMGRNNYLLLLSVNAEDFIRVFRVEDAVEEMKKDIMTEFPQVTEIFIEISEQ